MSLLFLELYDMRCSHRLWLQEAPWCRAGIRLVFFVTLPWLVLLPAVVLHYVGALSTPPNLIVFDLDGCLWKPELHNLARRGRGRQQQQQQGSDRSCPEEQHSPFQILVGGAGGAVGNRCRSQAGSIITLFQDVPGILDELYELDIPMAISSRTDQPEWAYELLGTFTLAQSGRTLQQVMTGPWIIDSTQRKVHHFHRLSQETGIELSDMVFFDNDPRNCKSVSRLGVTVGFCPHGLDRHIFHTTLSKFPVPWGVVGLEVK